MTAIAAETAGTGGQVLLALAFTTLAVAHSAAGEAGFVRPLLAADWSIPGVPRPAAGRLLRVAWHLTSVAWLALAVAAVGVSPLAAAAGAALLSGLAMLVWLRPHPAWPLFLVGGLAGLHGDGLLGDTAVAVGATAAVAAAVALAALHLYWVGGGRHLLDHAVPARPDGTPTLRPGPLATAAVAVLLLGFAGLVAAAAATAQPWYVTAAVLVGVAVLAIRAIGDGRHVGFTKSVRSSRFAELDDRWFTPTAALLALAAGTSVL